ncbi:MAG: hypothetical protein C0609_08805 [Deltaproteobacteria bacterium]|nr:MAG: hypothetical protein C0609_08805 [Deltaproteobacteria bacterium]
MTRKKAFALHLGFSALVLAAVVSLFSLWWFPPPYFFTEGGWRLLRLILFVDLTIGPLLTLIVFNTRKPRKELRRDLSVVVLLQIAALLSGLFTVYLQRTSAVVYADGFLYTMDHQSAAEIPGLLDIHSDNRGPLYAVIDLPDDFDERQKLRFKSLRTGVPLYNHSEFLTPLDDGGRKEIEHSMLPLEELLELYGGAKERILKEISSTGLKDDGLYILPAYGRYSTFILLLERDSLKIAGYVPDLKKGSSQ